MTSSFREILFGGGPYRGTTGVKRSPDTTNQFSFSAQQAKDQNPASSAVEPEVALVYRWNEGPRGISEYKIDVGRWPFRIYEKAGIAANDGKALRAQLAATPQLDPTAFGNRPGASGDADQGLGIGDTVYVLDQDRLDLLETQRNALAVAGDPKKSEAERERAKDDLVVALAQEVDQAAQGQGVPVFGNDANGNGKLDRGEFSALVAPIAARAPDDPVFLDALNQVRQREEQAWKADGRTPDEVGRIAAAGDRGDYAEVTAETKRQLVALGDAAGGPEAAKIAALTKRAGTYQAYIGGDEKQYRAAIDEGVKQAVREIRVDRHVRDLEAAWGKGGTDGAKAFLAKLREKTDTKDALAGSGALVAADPRVQKLVDQSIDAIAGSESSGEDRQQQMRAMLDLGAACQTVLYGDGAQAGAGKAFVDKVALKIIDKMDDDWPGDPTNLLHEQPFFSFMSREDSGGMSTSLLTAIAAHTASRGSEEIEASKKKGDLVTSKYVQMNSDAQWAARRGIEYFGAAAKAQDDKINTLYNELYHGLSGWGGIKPDGGIDPAAQLARDMEAIENLSPEHKKKAQELAQEGEKKKPQWEQQESIQLALNLYKTDLKKLPGFDDDAAVPMLFGTGIMLTKSKSFQEAMGGLPKLPDTKDDPYANAQTTNPPATGTIWTQRSARALATFAAVETLKGRVKDINGAMAENRYLDILQGKATASRSEIEAMHKLFSDVTADKNPDLAKYFKTLKADIGEARLRDIIAGRATPTEAERQQMKDAKRLGIGTEAVTRISGAGSAYLFYKNLGTLDMSPGDLVYYVPHTVMMLKAAQTALLPDAREILTGLDPSAPSSMETRIKVLQDRVKASNLGPAGQKLWGKALGGLQGLRGGGVDVLYVGADLTNAILNGAGIGGAKQDWVKAGGYGTATFSDLMFAVSAAKTLPGGSIAETGIGKIINRLGPVKFSGAAAVLQLVGAGVVQGKGAYDAAHKYDNADADAIQVLYGVKDRKVAEALAEHNDLLDEGALGILQTIFPGDEHLMGGDELTRSAGNVLTGTYSDLDYTRARLGRVFNNWTPQQAEEVSKIVRDMTAKDGKLPETQDDLKYLQLPPDPAKVDSSRYPNIRYNGETQRYEDSATGMYWEQDRWWAVPKKASRPAGFGSVPSGDPQWYNPGEQRLLFQNGSTKRLKPDSKQGLKAWLQNKGYLG